MYTCRERGEFTRAACRPKHSTNFRRMDPLADKTAAADPVSTCVSFNGSRDPPRALPRPWLVLLFAPFVSRGERRRYGSSPGGDHLYPDGGRSVAGVFLSSRSANIFPLASRNQQAVRIHGRKGSLKQSARFSKAAGGKGRWLSDFLSVRSPFLPSNAARTGERVGRRIRRSNKSWAK